MKALDNKSLIKGKVQLGKDSCTVSFCLSFVKNTIGMEIEMAFYKIADYIIDIQNRYKYIEKQCLDYLYTGNDKADFTIRVSDTDIIKEYKEFNKNANPGYLESICAYRQLSLELPLFDSFLLHASVINANGKGIAFLARSGVGKTTHTLNWKRLYPENVKIVNGDKPIIRFFDDAPYAYGTPWAGKENLQNNTKVALSDLCFIERSDTNIVESMTKNESINLLMQQVLHPAKSDAAIKSLELLDRLLKHCNVWKIKCNADTDSAKIAYEKIVLEC